MSYKNRFATYAVSGLAEFAAVHNNLFVVMSALPLRPQPIDATHALNRSAGVSNASVLRGRSFNCRATLFNCACEYTDKSVPLGKYWAMSLSLLKFAGQASLVDEAMLPS